MLEEMRVVELRPLARDTCGSGTWISHAKKDDLIYAILKGEPPASAIDQERSRDEAITKSLREHHKNSSGLEAILVDIIDDLIAERLRVFKADVLAAIDEGGASELRKRLEDEQVNVS